MVLTGVADIDHIPTSLLVRELTGGLMYVNGFDHEGRAVIIFNINRYEVEVVAVSTERWLQ